MNRKITKPVTLIADGVEIARFGDANYEFPWFSAPMIGLVKKHREWLTDVSRFNAEMQVADDENLDDAAEEALWNRRLAELRLTERDLDLFSNLKVQFSDGSVHRIGPTYIEAGDLRWRNGEELSDESAKFDRATTHIAALVDFCKGFVDEAFVFIVVVGIAFAGFALWLMR